MQKKTIVILSGGYSSIVIKKFSLITLKVRINRDMKPRCVVYSQYIQLNYVIDIYFQCGLDNCIL